MADMYWYARKEGNTTKLGLIDANGDAPVADTAFTVYTEDLPGNLSAEDDILPIDDDYTLSFCKGIAFDVLQMDGVDRPAFLQEFMDMKKKLNSKVVRLAWGHDTVDKPEIIGL